MADASIIFDARVQRMEDQRDADGGGRWQEKGGAFPLQPPPPHVSLSVDLKSIQMFLTSRAASSSIFPSLCLLLSLHPGRSLTP